MAEEGILSVRSLVESDLGPLRRFTGILDSMPKEKKFYGEGENKRESYQVSLNFKELDVLESIEPYHFPIYSVTVTESNRKKSKFGVFGVSLASILDQQYSDAQKDPSSPEYVRPSDRMDLKDCISKRIGMVLADGEEGRPPMHELFDGRSKDEAHPKGQDVPTAAWEVYMVEGIGIAGEEGISPLEKAMELLDGKTLAEFNSAALASDSVRSDVELLNSIGMAVSAPKSFTNTMIASKQFYKSQDGIFHKGPPPSVAPKGSKAK